MKIQGFHYYIYILLSSLLLFAGCSEDSLSETSPSSDSFYITVSVPIADNTRAGSDDLNEFKVTSLHLFFFPSSGHDDASSEYIWDYVVPEAFSFSKSFSIPLPDNALLPGGLFGISDNDCLVYAVANVDDSKLLGKSVNDLKATFIDSDFDQTIVQPHFAMDGTSILSLDRSNRIVSGNIILQRAAAKLSLSVNLPNSIDVSESIVNSATGVSTEEIITYTPRPDDIHVWFSNGVSASQLNCSLSPTEDKHLFSHEIAPSSGSSFLRDDNQPVYKYIQEIPFYSYPNAWDPYSPTGNSYLTLVVPWSYKDKNGNNLNKVTYYKLAIQPNHNYISRNTHYDMRVTISRLGGSSVDSPVDILLDWNYAMQWNSQQLFTDIKEVSYLLLNNNDFDASLNGYYFEMNNESDISIPYESSHPVKIEAVTLSWHDFKNNADRQITLSPSGSPSRSNYRYDNLAGYNNNISSYFAGIEIDHENSLLKFSRQLYHILWASYTEGRNTYSMPEVNTNESAINAFTFKIKIRHDVDNYSPDNPTQNADIYIQQIPAIYITALGTQVSGLRFINNNNSTYRVNTGSGWNTNYTYYGYIGSSAPNNSSQLQYYLGSAGEKDNKNTYILNITKFNDGDYVIADPRKRSVDNLPANNDNVSATAAWSVADNKNKRLENYYPSDPSSDKTNFIAPQLRIASQWGVTQKVTYNAARRRCASYQENGRSAGRWRVPTVAEIKFICDLSNRQLIPYLFGDADDTSVQYWCASGAVEVNNKAQKVTIMNTPSSSSTLYVRCVYDEWYWKNDTLTDKTKFFWGDRPRSESGNQ